MTDFLQTAAQNVFNDLFDLIIEDEDFENDEKYKGLKDLTISNIIETKVFKMTSMDPNAVKRVFNDLFNLIFDDEDFDNIIHTEIYNKIIQIENDDKHMDHLHRIIRRDIKHYKGERTSKLCINLNSGIIHPNYTNYGDAANLNCVCRVLNDDYYKKIIRKQKKDLRI